MSPRRKKAGVVGLRATPADLAAWRRAARADGRSLSDWIARRCNGDDATRPDTAAADEPTSNQVATEDPPR